MLLHIWIFQKIDWNAYISGRSMLYVAVFSSFGHNIYSNKQIFLFTLSLILVDYNYFLALLTLIAWCNLHWLLHYIPVESVGAVEVQVDLFAQCLFFFRFFRAKFLIKITVFSFSVRSTGIKFVNCISFITLSRK